MHKFTKLMLVSILLTVISILLSFSSTGSVLRIATVMIAVFWVLSVLLFFARGFNWYKKDLKQRAIEEADSENDDQENDDSRKRNEIEFLFD
jgi:amino acid permease